MSDAVATVRKFLGSIDAAVSTKDPELIQELVGMLSEDFRYQNRPQRMIEGLEDFFQWFMEFATCEHMECDIIRIAADGDWVLTERRDTWTMNGIRFTFAMMGSFEVREGKIRTFIDYGTDNEQWKASGQMPEGFFERWASNEVLYEKV